MLITFPTYEGHVVSRIGDGYEFFAITGPDLEVYLPCTGINHIRQVSMWVKKTDKTMIGGSIIDYRDQRSHFVALSPKATATRLECARMMDDIIAQYRQNPARSPNALREIIKKLRFFNNHPKSLGFPPVFDGEEFVLTELIGMEPPT